MSDETNEDPDLVSIEAKFENAKADRLIAKHRWDSAKGKLHMTLVARREAGEKLTIEDMKAIKDSAIDNDPDVRETYLMFISADSEYRAAKVKFDDATRRYWDSKPLKFK